MALAPVRAFQLLAQASEREQMRSSLCVKIMVLRRMGYIDSANKLSEWLHCLARGYMPYVLLGFPDDAKNPGQPSQGSKE